MRRSTSAGVRCSRVRNSRFGGRPAGRFFATVRLSGSGLINLRRDEFGRNGRGRAECRVVERGEIFARGASRVFLEFLRVPILAWNRALLVGVGGDEARIDREPSAPTKPSAMQR